jgi:uncharacterized protein (DUF697 family)
MADRKSRATAIILAYSCAHATVAAILANTVVGDAVVLTPLTILMIYQLSRLCEQDLTTGAIAALAAQLFGAVAGGYLASKLVSWIPFFGNAINASVTFGITQVIGWAAFAMFDQGISQEEAIRFAEKQKVSKEEMDRVVASMTDDDRKRFETAKKKVADKDSPEDEKMRAIEEMSDLIAKYR